MSALSAVLSTRVGRRRYYEEVSYTECIGQGNNFRLIPTIKMETRNTVEGNLGSELPVICNHWEVMTARNRKTLKLFEKFCVNLEKRPITVKFSKFCFETFIETPIDVLCYIFVKFGRREIEEIVRCLPDKKKQKLPGSPAVATKRIAPKIYQGQPRTMFSFVRSFVRYCGQGSSLLWTPALRPLCRSNAPAQGEEGNW